MPKNPDQLKEEVEEAPQLWLENQEIINVIQIS